MPVATVVLSFTQFGALFYTFIVLAGAAYPSCPYQTPGARVLRHAYLLAAHRDPYPVRTTAYDTPHLARTMAHSTPDLIRTVVRSTSSAIGGSGWCVGAFARWWDKLRGLERSAGSIFTFLVITLLSPILLSICLAVDAFLLTRTMVRAFFSFALPLFQLYERGLDTCELDLRYISWVFNTSLDRDTHMLTLKFLATTVLARYDHGLVSACFNILVGCMSTVGSKVVVTQGLESFAEMSVLCFLRVLSNLTAVDPASGVLDYVQWRYTRVFPPEMNFEDFPSYHCFSIIHTALHPCPRPKIQWERCEPSNVEHAVIANFAQSGYQRTQPQKVPRWTLHFALRSLSEDPLIPLSPSSVVIDCLSVIAIDLGCTVLNTTTLDERCVYI